MDFTRQLTLLMYRVKPHNLIEWVDTFNTKEFKLTFEYQGEKVTIQRFIRVVHNSQGTAFFYEYGVYVGDTVILTELEENNTNNRILYEYLQQVVLNWKDDKKLNAAIFYKNHIKDL